MKTLGTVKKILENLDISGFANGRVGRKSLNSLLGLVVLGGVERQHFSLQFQKKSEISVEFENFSKSFSIRISPEYSGIKPE